MQRELHFRNSYSSSRVASSLYRYSTRLFGKPLYVFFYACAFVGTNFGDVPYVKTSLVVDILMTYCYRVCLFKVPFLLPRLAMPMKGRNDDY
jgi:hypothetical protein